MKIRTSLVIALFVLSALPLGGIVIYSYYSSRAALESAYHAEAARLTAQMDRRLGNIRDELQQRLAEVSALPNLSNPGTEKAPVVGNVLMAMGDAAPLVDSIEIQPMVHPVPAPAPAPVKRQVTVTAAAAPAAPPAPIVINIPPMPKMPRFTFTDQQREYLKKISELGQKLGTHAKELTQEERNAIQQELRDAQTAFNESMKETSKQFGEEVQKAVKAREAARKLRREQHDEMMRTMREREQERADAAAEAEQERIDAQQEAAQEKADAAAEAQADSQADTEAPPNEAQKRQWKVREQQTNLILGHHFNIPLTSEGALVGRLQAHVSAKEVIRRVLGGPSDDRSEITFAIDNDNNLYTRNNEDRQALDRLGIPKRVAANQPLSGIPNWVVVQRRDPQSGLRVGVARPFGEDLEGLRKAAAKNFGYGIALIFVALVGILPIANHITRDVELVQTGAERIAHGDLTTRIPVRSKNEIGHLASAFNRMAEDLSLQQQRIVEQERAAIEYERKSVELEEARRFQLSMLPKEVPRLKTYDIAVFTHTATEVGGDYYDFHVEPDGTMSITIGDATGHGARAGTMVAVIKALFAGYGDQSPAEFLIDATEKVRRMELGRMAMALQLARFNGGSVTIASAGMPPAYIHRKSNGEVEEIAHSATPLGTLGDSYRNIDVALQPGDTLLFMSDGFPELMNAAGQQLGYATAAEAFRDAAKAIDSDAVIAELAKTVRRWHGEQPPNDDVTFVVVRAV
jgi:serine phosphatase RsbU (regulator of sigma subunit)